MTIITGVPTTVRKPQSFHRFVYQTGGRSLTPLSYRSLLVGVAKGGSMVVSTIYPVDDITSVESLAGVGSELTLMAKEAFRCGNLFGFLPQINMIAVAENAAGVAAIFTVTLTGPATESGNLLFAVAGRPVTVPVSLGDSVTTMATALAAAVNALKNDLPITATSAAGVVTLTMNHKGEWGADLKIRSILPLVAGTGVTIANPTPGTGVNDPTAALALALGVDFDTIAMANHKAADIALALTHVTAAWQPAEKKWRHVVFGENGTVGTATPLAIAANDRGIELLHAYNCQSLPSEMAVAYAMAISSRSRPNANWDKLVLPLYPPPDTDVLTNSQIETLLASGVTPALPVIDANSRVSKLGVMEIVKAVTTQTTLAGQPFEVLRDLAVPRVGAFVARQIDAAYAARFGAGAYPDGVLLDDDAIPRVRDMISAILYACQDAKIITNVDNDLNLLVVEKDLSAPGRLNVDVTYTVVLGLHQVAFVHRVTV